MNIRKLNLNLLVTLDVLLTENHVSKAAEKLYITQSACSIALAQLREFFDDALLVRSGGVMTPTPKALVLHSKIQEVLALIETSILQDVQFNPATMEKNFVIGMNDYNQQLILPPLMQHLQHHAPNVTIKIKQISDLNDSRLFDSNVIDIGIGPFYLESTNIESIPIFSDTAICVINKKNKILKTKNLTIKQLLKIPHVAVTYEEDSHQSLTHKAIAEHGYKHKITLTVPSMLAALEVVSKTDYITVTAKKLAESFNQAHQVRLIKPPIVIPPVTVNAVWHRKFNQDNAHQWLRNVLTKKIKL